MMELRDARQGKSAARRWGGLAAGALCVGLLGLAGCKKTDPDPAPGSAALPATASSASSLKARPPFYDLSSNDPMKGHIDEISIPPTTGDLGLHIVCSGGETKIMIAAGAQLMKTVEELPVNERVGNGPVQRSTWLTGTNQSTLIYNGDDPWSFVNKLRQSPTYKVQFAPPGYPVINAQFDTSVLAGALKGRGAACNWAQFGQT